MSETDDRILSMEEAMDRLSLARAEVYRRVKDGHLKAEKADHRITFVDSEVERYASTLAEERESLQGVVTHWLETFAGRAERPEEAEMPDVSENPVPEQIAELGRRIMLDSILAGVEDLYMDPLHEGDRLLYSLAGRRTETARFPSVLSASLKEWLKKQATLPDADAHAVREGLGQQTHDTQTSQFRLTVVPTLLGEHIHIHFFPHYDEVRVDMLGYTSEQIEMLRQMLSGRPGLLVVAGAADSAAEQHRLALAHELSAQGRLVVSLEHHVQYRSDSLVQLDVGRTDGVGFTALWRAAMGMLPDVIFLDECRDGDEAQALIEGVYSGAVVVAHVGSASALEALGQLIRFEPDRQALATVLIGVIERVVCRRLPSGGRMRPVTPHEARCLGVSEDTEIPVAEFVSQDTGATTGRHAVYGLWPMEDGLRAWIRTPDMPAPELQSASYGLSLAQAIQQAVLSGYVAIEDALPYLNMSAV